MAKHLLAFLVLQILLIEEIVCCGCGCGQPTYDYNNYNPYPSYDNLGVKACDDYEIPPLEIQKPICQPPPSLYKELKLAPQPSPYAPPCCPGGSWVRHLPKCVRKVIRHPFCISKANLLNQKLALYKQRAYASGYNQPPFGGCGCGCGR